MASEREKRPWTAFNFKVELIRDGDDAPLCDAAFTECDGLEMNMEPRTVQEGGNNAEQIQLVQPVTYGQLSLRRGMTDCFDLWDWFEQVMGQGHYGRTADGRVIMLSSQAGDPDEKERLARFELRGCLPVRLRAPSLNATEGQVAIEELEIAYQSMERKR